jgi:peptidyl-prolyl cis-trans isomerase C
MNRLARSLFATTFAALGLAAHAGSLSAQEAATNIKLSADQVLARVDGQDITFSDLVAEIGNLPQRIRQLPIQTLLGPLYPDLLERLIEKSLMVKAAEEAKIEESEAFKIQMAQARRTILEQAYLDQLYAEKITDDYLKAKYEAYVGDTSNASEERRARHILLKTEDEAKAAIARLEKGEDFAELAKELSTGPSGPNGGDLGYFVPEDMVAPFSEAAFAMEPGSFGKTPVQTQFGWHVIKVEDARPVAPLPFEQLADQLRGSEQQAIMEATIQALRVPAQIERFDLQGAPLGSN